ncbi:MAG TPA: ABC transporter permease [Chitinophagaceae bacterium]|nr:ABC transporter permease [Chitinophagaceae bacterium]
MFKNFFKTTIRTLWKNKGYSFLNIFGLAIGIACAGLIFLWVEDEVNYDSNNLKKDRLFIVKTNNKVDDGVFTHSSTPGPLGPAMQSQMPGIANTCRVTEDGTSMLFSFGNKSVYASGNFAEPSIFSMFTLPFVEGNADNAFVQLHSIVITEKTAKIFFSGEKNIVGKTVRMDNKQDYVVTGVLKDLPENSSFQFEWLAPFKVWYDENPSAAQWFNFGLTTYIELKPGVDPVAFNKKLLDPLYDFTTQKNESSTSTVHVFLFGMNDWHLRDDFDNGKETGSGRIQYVHLFTIIAWIILFIACINFMNLATAGSERRSKEIGVRKVLGSGKKNLVLQFMGEAVFMALLSAVAAVFIISVVLPAFNLLVQKNLLLGLSNPYHFTALLLLTLICGLIAGSYPSLYLSSFNPVFVLKGIKIKTGSAAVIRKGLVVIQFAVSIILIIGTIIIYQQIQHIKSRDLGYNKNNLIQMGAQEDLVKNFSSIKQDLLNTGVVENAALADHETISGGNNTTSIDWPGKTPNSNIVISQRLVSPEFVSTVGMHITEGRDFQATDAVEFGEDRMPKDSTQVFNVIVTQSMEKLLGNGSAVCKTMQCNRNNGTFHMIVTGVVKDYVYGDMYGQSAPVIFYYIPQASSLMYVRTSVNSDPETALAKIGAVMKKDNPAYPFEYKFVDDQFNSMFISEMLISKLSRVFASLAIIISCLGLFGLAAYTAERRTKEIGIRKVLGATVSGIAGLLSKDFLKLVTISCIIAFPVAWWMMDNWLNNYAYRIKMNLVIFLVAGILAVVIALLTVSFQAIKAAIANPVNSLRSE